MEEPWVTYEGFIFEEQWKEFEKKYYNEEFQAISRKARESGRHNEFPHHMGQRSYNRAEKKWIKEGLLPPPPDIDSTNASTSIAQRGSRRPLLWKLAHEKKTSQWLMDH